MLTGSRCWRTTGLLTLDDQTADGMGAERFTPEEAEQQMCGPAASLLIDCSTDGWLVQWSC
jgi:hypothetical protein